MLLHPVQLVHAEPCMPDEYYNNTAGQCQACPTDTTPLKMSNGQGKILAHKCVKDSPSDIASDFTETEWEDRLGDLVGVDYQTLEECTCKDNYFVGSSSKDVYRGTYNNRGNQYDYCADWSKNDEPWCRTHSQGDCGDDGDGNTWRRCGAGTNIPEQTAHWNCSQMGPNQYDACVDCCQEDTGAGSRHHYGNHMIGVYHKEWDTCVKNACLS